MPARDCAWVRMSDESLESRRLLSVSDRPGAPFAGAPLPRLGELPDRLRGECSNEEVRNKLRLALARPPSNASMHASPAATINASINIDRIDEGRPRSSVHHPLPPPCACSSESVSPMLASPSSPMRIATKPVVETADEPRPDIPKAHARRRRTCHMHGRRTGTHTTPRLACPAPGKAALPPPALLGARHHSPARTPNTGNHSSAARNHTRLTAARRSLDVPVADGVLDATGIVGELCVRSRPFRFPLLGEQRYLRVHFRDSTSTHTTKQPSVGTAGIVTMNPRHGLETTKLESSVKPVGEDRTRAASEG